MTRNRWNGSTERNVLIGLSAVVFALLAWLSWLSPGVEGGMDSYNHYLIARFSWKHPGELLLDQWGKPLYNILASPFAQLGMMGVEIFNILLLIGSAWLTYFTAKSLNFQFGIAAFILTLASPIFFDNTISGLTEPLNAFLLMMVVYLFAERKMLTGAVVAGFLPFARSEGYVILAVIGFYLLFVHRHYRAFFLLFAGSLVMNGVGWLVEGDPLWIYNTNPYIKYQIESTRDQQNICGSGSLWHYVGALPWMMGKPRLLLFVMGMLMILIAYLRNPADHVNRVLFFPIAGVYALYFAVHSAIWYFGAMGSCGYERVMLVIDPLAALVMAFAAELVLRYLDNLLNPKWWRRLLMTFALLAGFLIFIPWKIYGHKYPIDISNEQKLFVEAAEWYNQSDFDDRMKYFLYPYFNMLTGIDPKDHEHFTEIWSFDIQYAPKGSIVIWDGHFGPNEGKVPLELLKNHPDFVLIKSFFPEQPFKTLNDYNFEIHIFERIREPKPL